MEDFGLVSLHMKSTLTGQSFTISRNWLALGGTVPPGPASPQTAEHQNKRHANTPPP